MALEIGDRVMILNSAAREDSSVILEEGVATIRELTDTEGYFKVEFDDEPGEIYYRFAQEENKVDGGKGE